MTKRGYIGVALAVLLLGAVAFEVWRALHFYSQVRSSRDALLSIKADLRLETLGNTDEEVISTRAKLTTAATRLQAARRFVDSDPFLRLAGFAPRVGKNARAVRHLVHAADDSARAGLAATEVLLAFNHSEDSQGTTSVQNALAFLKSQEAPMAAVERGLERIKASRSRVPSGLIGPLEKARRDLDDALSKLDALVRGYDQADRLLPAMLGYDGPHKYLVLPQNDTEIFPSGGLISNYGIATFDQGRLADVDFEYFVNLYDRWQRLSGGEYVEPPLPLKNHLLGGISWALGEAGWYPDFPTTAQLATTFVRKGGAPPTDGTIAIDLQFVEALLEFLGPVTVPEYDVTVAAHNLADVTLEKTRGESPEPGAPGKAFLSPLARELLDRIFSSPRGKWVDLLKLLDRMGRERHLQMYFADPALETLARDYGFDGGIVELPDDFVLVADTSVKSTKLNLILQPAIKIDVELTLSGRAFVRVTYEVRNPFPEWRRGREPALVRALMNEGLYGSYLRVYTRQGAQLRDVRVNGIPTGPEAVENEVGRLAFGRYFPVPPGETVRAEFIYATPDVVKKAGRESFSYGLYVQKEAGTRAIPLEVNVKVPEGSSAPSLQLDGRDIDGMALKTDLRTDRMIRAEFRHE